jgi:uncharacterized protein (DUF608 family)
MRGLGFFIVFLACCCPVVAAPTVRVAGDSSVIRSTQPVTGVEGGAGALLQQARTGADFRYIIDGLPAGGRLLIEAGFAEIQPDQAATRQFSMIVNGKPALRGFNPAREAGGPFRGVIKGFSITPPSGRLEFRFTGEAGREALLGFLRLQGSGVEMLVGAEIPDLVPSAARAPWDPDTGEVAQTSSREAWLSGVPHGGLGTGKFEILTNGVFANLTINNNWDHPVRRAEGTFLAIGTKQVSGGGLTRLLRVAEPYGFRFGFANAKTVALCVHRGLFPFASLGFEDEGIPLQVAVTSWSPLVPHSVADSSLPGAVIEVELVNPQRRPVSAGVVLSWENILGRGGSRRPGDQYGSIARVQHTDVATSGLAGVLMSPVDPPGGDRRSTFVGNCFVGVETSGVVVTRILGWNARAAEIPWWQGFARRMRLERRDPAKSFVTESHDRAPVAAAVCATLNLAPGERRVVPFVVSWYSPRVVTAGDDSQTVRAGAAAYADRFSSSLEVAAEIAVNRPRLRAETAAWGDLIRRSSLPQWLAVKIINDQSVIVSNSLLRPGARFSMLVSPEDGDGAIGDLAHRAVSSGFLATMFPDLNRSELEMYGQTQGEDGRIAPHLGNVHGDFSPSAEPPALEDRPDLAALWVAEVARHYRGTGDGAFLSAAWPMARRALDYLASTDRDRDGLAEGATALDLYQERSGAFSYTAGLAATAFEAGRMLAQAVGDTSAAESLAARADAARTAVRQRLWRDDGGWLAKSCDATSPSGPAGSFAGGLAGDWLAGNLALVPVLPQALLGRAVDGMMRRHVLPFNPVPAAEVSVLGQAQAAASPLPLLQAYLGCLAVQAGRVEAGTDLLRRAYDAAYGEAKNPWAQSLFYDSPGGRQGVPRSVPASSASWHALTAYTGVFFDAPSETLYFDPRPLPDTGGDLSAPVFTPLFWGWLESSEAASSATLTVLRTFAPEGSVRIRRIARRVGDDGQPEGLKILDRPFLIREGSRLGLRRRPLHLILE